MAHHKRRRPHHQRASCKLCKPHKDERYKNSYQAQPMEMKRALQDEHCAPPRTKKKDTLTWCRGKEGVQHKPAWVNKGRAWGHAQQNYMDDWRLACDGCGKHLGSVSWYSKTISVRRFPGREQFFGGACLKKAA